MSWRRLLDLLAVCLTAIGLWAVAVWIWPFFGPVGIVVVLIVAVFCASLFDFVVGLLRKRSSGHTPGAGGPPDSAVPVGHAHKQQQESSEPHGREDGNPDDPDREPVRAVPGTRLGQPGPSGSGQRRRDQIRQHGTVTAPGLQPA